MHSKTTLKREILPVHSRPMMPIRSSTKIFSCYLPSRFSTPVTWQKGDINSGNEYVKLVQKIADQFIDNLVTFCAKIEAEIAELEPEEKEMFLEELGVENSGLDRLIQAAYENLGLITYFTAGPKEVRAWTIRKGTKAPQAAGVIHTDFERGFIRAETIAYEDYSTLGSEKAAKEAGKMRQEGKEYVVKDGDVMLFRFNV